MKLVTLKKEYDLLLKDTITEYLNPNFVYLPIKEETKLKIDPKGYVHRGEELYDLQYSPISGKILGIRECYSTFGFSKFLVVGNDFKEKTVNRLGVRKNLSKISKVELFELLKIYDEKMYNDFNMSFKKIMISGIEEQPYVGNFMYINVNYTKEILDMIDSLGDIFDINDINFLIKDTDYNSINSINDMIGMYNNVNVKFLPNKYLISHKDILSKFLNINEEFLYLNVEQIYDLYQYLKRRKPKEEKFITITGNAINNPQVIKCKVGVVLSDVINDLIELNTDQFVVVENSLLTNKELDYKRYIITNDLRAIYIMKKEKIKEEECIRCGKCDEICPMKIKVSSLVNNRKCSKDLCIHCGLCSYICPSYIKINRYLDGDSNE
ncbi:MAG: hypothetical protein E7158_04125 [Firmicutes bacterium]|nr:hypothetical protein [Bacillota bacterium]